MSIITPIKFRNIRTVTQGSVPFFFVEDIAAHYFLEAEDCHQTIEKFGHSVAAGEEEGIANWAVEFEGFQALVALADFMAGGDPGDL